MSVLMHGSFVKFNYPFHLLLMYMYDVGYRINGHCIQIGPFALCLVWRGSKIEKEAQNHGD